MQVEGLWRVLLFLQNMWAPETQGGKRVRTNLVQQAQPPFPTPSVRPQPSARHSIHPPTEHPAPPSPWHQSHHRLPCGSDQPSNQEPEGHYRLRRCCANKGHELALATIMKERAMGKNMQMLTSPLHRLFRRSYSPSSLLAFLCSQFLCDLADICEQSFFVCRNFGAIDVRLLCMADFKYIRHT